MVRTGYGFMEAINKPIIQLMLVLLLFASVVETDTSNVCLETEIWPIIFLVDILCTNSMVHKQCNLLISGFMNLHNYHFRLIKC